jgi:plastocyanin
MKHYGSGARVMMAVAAALGLAGANAYGADVTINMVSGMKFDSAVVAINAGDTVTWTNTVALTHTTFSGDPGDPNPGQLWNSPFLSQGQSFAHTFQAGETSDFFCSIHNTAMFGRVIVDGTGVQGTMIPASTIANTKITFDIWALNFTPGSQNINAQVKIKIPNGNTFTVLDVNGTLGPMGRIRVPFTKTLPPGAPAGTYTVTLEIRDQGGSLLSSDQDTYTKSALESEDAPEHSEFSPGH